MSAYDKNYLDGAMSNLGEAFDFAVNVCRKNPDTFLNLFISSGIADHFGKGNPKYVAGMSGTELAMEVFRNSGLDLFIGEPCIDYAYSPEYWCGWILAYYQWKSGRSFREIREYISADAVLRMYSTLHEASEDKFADIVEGQIKRNWKPARLQQQRKICGYSQRELAEKSGVNLRTLQQYELKTKDINKASAGSVKAMADVLGCKIEDILE